MIIQHGVKYVIDWALLTKWSNASNIVIALFAGVVCFVYWRQLVTMRTALAETRASNEIATRALELGRRAWIVIHGAPSLSTYGWTFEEVTVENVADMPAVIRRFGTGSVEGKPSLSPPSNWQYINSAEVIIRDRQAKLDFPKVELPVFNRGNHAESIAALGRTVIYCVVEYTDCFEKTWSTTAYWQDWRESQDGNWKLGPAYTKLT